MLFPIACFAAGANSLHDFASLNFAAFVLSCSKLAPPKINENPKAMMMKSVGINVSSRRQAKSAAGKLSIAVSHAARGLGLSRSGAIVKSEGVFYEDPTDRARRDCGGAAGARFGLRRIGGLSRLRRLR